MERVIQDELLSKTQKFLNATQHGFIPGKSCTTNLITLTDNIANNLAKDIGTDIIYFDFAKAFDTVNQDLLLTKLKNNFKIKGRLLKFIANYLRDRSSVSSSIMHFRSTKLSAQAYLRDRSWGLYYLLYSLMT